MYGENNTKIKSQILSVKNKSTRGLMHLGASPILCVYCLKHFVRKSMTFRLV